MEPGPAEKGGSPDGRLWTKSERRVWVTTLFVGCAVVYACRISMSLCIVTISKEFGWQKTDSGLVLSAFYWGYTMTQVLGGYWSDRVGGEAVMTLAAAGWILVIFATPHLLYISSDKSITLSILTISRVIFGCLQGVHYPSLGSLLSRRVSEKNRGSALGGALSGTKFGTLISGCFGSLVLEYYGWRNVFYTVATCALVWLLFLRFHLVAKQRARAAMISIEAINEREKAPRIPVPWLMFFKSPAFWVIVLGHVSFTAAFHILINWLPTYFAESFPDAKGWVFNVVPWVIATPLTMISGHLADRMIQNDEWLILTRVSITPLMVILIEIPHHHGSTKTFVRKFFTTITLAGSSSFLMLKARTESYGASLFCMTAALACLAMHTGGIMANVQDVAIEFTGSLFGLVNTAGAVSGFVFVYVVGYILETTHSWSMTFLQTAVVGYTGAILYLIYGTGNPIV